MRLLAPIFAAMLLCSASFVHAESRSPKAGDVPAGFEQYLVYMATGTVPFAPHPDPEITGCGTSLFCDGDYFHHTIMGRDADEVEAEAARAKAYFVDRFGIDVDAMVAAGRMRFFSFFLDPRGEYRAYTVAGRRAPAEGWVVRDGGFIAEVVDPAGIELGGDFANSGLPPLPFGGLMLFGNYNILATGKNGKRQREMVISYRSGMPMIANGWGEFVINCELSLNDFASGVHGGKAQGMGLVLPGPGGLTLSWRNVLTMGSAKL